MIQTNILVPVRTQSRLKTLEGPRQNINEGPHKINFVVCFSILILVLNDFLTKNTNIAILLEFGALSML